jgi:hypothetical protein
MTNKVKFLNRRYVLLLVLLAALLRIAYILTLEEKWYYFDTAHYDQAACAIVAGEGFGSSLHYYNEYDNYCLEPMYPIFLAGVYGIFGHSFLAVRLVQMLLSLFQLYFIYKIVLYLKPKAAPFALIFGAIYPFFIYTAGLLYVTQLFSLLLTLMVFWLLQYRNSGSIGWLSLAALALGAAISARPVVLPATVLIAGWIFFFAQMPWMKRIGHIAWTALLIILTLTPWTIRNWNVFGVISPGRACLAETRVFEDVRRQFAEQDALNKPTFDAKMFRVELTRNNEDTLFTCYLDNKIISIIKPMEKLILPDPMHVGLIFRGGSQFKIDDASFSGMENGGEGSILCSNESGLFSASPIINADSTGVTILQSEDVWTNSMVFSDSIKLNSAELVYPDSVSPYNIRRAALLIGLDSNTLTANGYMLWLQPWRAADLWRVENGNPIRPVNVLDLHKKENPVRPLQLILDNPVRFFSKHFVPEFLNFWTPEIKRITTSSNVKFVMNLASFIFFAPLLLFSLVGIVALRKQWRELLLILIPIVNISLFYSVFFTELRYRIPIDGFLIILSSLGFYSIYGFWRWRKMM